MSPQSLVIPLFPLAKASATQPRRKIPSPISHLVGWLTTLWASKGRKRAKKERSLVPDPPHSTPVTLYEEPETPLAIYATDSDGLTSRDGDHGHDALGTPISLSQFVGHDLTQEELDYVVDALLVYLEEGKAAPPDSGREEHEYHTPERTGRRLRHGLWSPASSSYVMYDNDNDPNVSQAGTLEMGDAYDQEWERTACYAPKMRFSEVMSPYQFEFEFEGDGSDQG